MKPFQCVCVGGGGGGGGKGSVLLENNAKISPAPLKYFLMLPIIIATAFQIPKRNTAASQLHKICKEVWSLKYLGNDFRSLARI